MADDQKSEKTADTPASPEAGAQQTQEVVVNDNDAVAGYANFCRVSSTPEELILDLGLNPTPYATGKVCLLYTSPSPRDQRGSRMPSSA